MKRAIAVLIQHGKRLTQEGLDAKSGGVIGGFDLNAFKKIAPAAVRLGILTNGTDKHRMGYGLPEWD